MIILDFETRSRADLKAVGTDAYCADPSTEVLCMAAMELDGNSPRAWVWQPSDGPLPDDLVDAITQGPAGRHSMLAAHHARFDQGIWEYVAVEKYGFPEVNPNKWYCSMAQMRVNALPASLENAALALKVTHKKNNRGRFLIQKLCIPDKKTGQFNYNPQLLAEMAAYCLDDVKATRDIVKACRMMTHTEHADWLINEKVNERGVRIDMPLATLAQEYADAEMSEISGECQIITNGVVTKPTQRARIKDWIIPRLNPDAEALLVKYDKGERKHTLEKSARDNFFARADEGDIDVPPEVYNLMACYDDANKSSVAKFKRMTDMAMHDDRVRGAFIYGGASTLRFTSRGLQLHNFKRDCYSVEDTENLRHYMLGGAKLQTNVMDSLGKLLRPTLIPEEGKVFVVNDWSSIENRMLPWLADDPRAVKKLDAFRVMDSDPKALDTYQLAALDAGVKDRQIGKVIELSLGFLGANGAFNSMARNYGVYLPEHEVTRIVKAWRRKNAWAVDFGNKLERCALHAMRNKGVWFKTGRVKYRLNGTVLECRLPSGTVISYPEARLEHDPQWDKITITALKANWTPSAGDAEWPRFKLWRGLLAENATQAECATLLREAMSRCDSLGLPIVLHCHDELVAEVDKNMADWAANLIKTIMEQPSAWASGLPLKAVPTVVSRYGK